MHVQLLPLEFPVGLLVMKKSVSSCSLVGTLSMFSSFLLRNLKMFRRRCLLSGCLWSKCNYWQMIFKYVSQQLQVPCCFLLPHAKTTTGHQLLAVLSSLHIKSDIELVPGENLEFKKTQKKQLECRHKLIYMKILVITMERWSLR